MKNKILKIAISLVCLFCVSCTFYSANKDATKRFDIEYNDERIDTQSLDEYFLNNDEYSSYSELKKNSPDLLKHIKVIESSGDTFKNNFKMFRFSIEENGFLDDATFLYVNQTYYQLGVSFGGFGVTEFIRRQGDAGFWLYFIYSYGSGIHRSGLGIMNFPKGEFYTIDDLDLGTSIDYTFVINDEDNTIDLYKADIDSYRDNDDFSVFNIKKKNLAFAKIDEMPKTKVK